MYINEFAATCGIVVATLTAASAVMMAPTHILSYKSSSPSAIVNTDLPVDPPSRSIGLADSAPPAFARLRVDPPSVWRHR